MRREIGTRLKEERKRLGFTQADFAETGGASKRSQIEWEKGAVAPNAEFLAAIATTGADVLYILTGQRSIPTEATLSHEEAALLDNYRHSDREGRKSIENVSAAFSQPRPDKKNAMNSCR